ncbi:hypothetical protein ACFQX7_02295 [Luedemannella flava]
MVRHGGERVAEWVTTSLLAAAAYLALLPWDLRSIRLDPGTGETTTAVTGSRVISLAVILVVLAGYLGWRDQPLRAAAAFVGAPPGALMLASLATHPASNWPVGWVFFTVILGLDAVIVALVVRNARNILDRLRSQA